MNLTVSVDLTSLLKLEFQQFISNVLICVENGVEFGVGWPRDGAADQSEAAALPTLPGNASEEEKNQNKMILPSRCF